MARTPKDVTDAELSVLLALWERGAATIRQLTGLLYSKQTSSYYATVQKLLQRLEAKSYVTRDRRKWPHLFQATVGRGDLIRRRLKETADKFCDGSLEPLLIQLVRAQDFTPEDLQSLRKLLDELDAQNPPDNSPSKKSAR